jgi:ATP-dependent DNA helicase RecG
MRELAHGMLQPSPGQTAAEGIYHSAGAHARDLSFGLVEQSGRTKATRYFVPPALLREAGLDALTTLTRVQPHRLRALILEDLERFPDSSKADIWRRVGPEIPERTFRRALEDLVESGRVEATGETRARSFRLKPVSGHGVFGGQ